MNKLMKITRRGGKKMKKWKKRLVVDGVLLYVVDIQNPIVTFLTLESMVKIKKCVEVYGGTPTMLVHLIHLELIN
jgi:hypothetical protein